MAIYIVSVADVSPVLLCAFLSARLKSGSLNLATEEAHHIPTESRRL